MVKMRLRWDFLNCDDNCNEEGVGEVRQVALRKGRIIILLD